jgi:hypothetical protein
MFIVEGYNFLYNPYISLEEKYLIVDQRVALSHRLAFYDARVFYLRESIGPGNISVSVSGTYPYLNLCSYIYISFFKNVVPRTGTRPT